ncbi:hypothetical protein C1645_232469 [Glomus cerebriforme]|uniref:Protein kinase domain-containing protein n=1 Tax=Glomus cerebriforme TaxID=658196 RepID=A0A397SR75_9GLOM|nr:hypothetical protein C1645_232469 [Glomus cerebriforme]
MANENYLENFDNYFDYSEFEDVHVIESGSTASTKHATWKNTLYVLKCFKNETTKEKIVNEIRLQKMVDHDDNIITLVGISKDPTSENYLLVLENANKGTLQDYLSDQFDKLKWDDKFDLALQLARAISCLHNHNIIHCDLHARNVLVHEKIINGSCAKLRTIKLADFGLSTKITEVSSTSKVKGITPYVDPKYLNNLNNLNNQNEDYKLNKKSDIYSIGVIMWQISSGRQPFENIGDCPILTLSIIGGRRETTIYDTPPRYSKLYMECWNGEPDDRPDIQEVITILEEIISHNMVIDIIDDVDKEKESSFLETPKLISSPSNESINNIYEDNEDLSIGSDKGYIFDNYSSPSQESLQSLSSGSNHSEDLSNKIDNIITTMTKIHEERGYDIDFQIQQLIIEKIVKLNQTYDFICFLTENQNKADYIWLLGLFYYYIEEDNDKAFQLFSKVSNFPLAQFYLTNYYYRYIFRKSIKKDKKKSFKYYKELAEQQEFADAQYQLGNRYYYGIGTKKNKGQAFYWYKKAAKNGNINAKNIIEEKESKIFKMLVTEKSRQHSLHCFGELLIKIKYKNTFHYLVKAAEYGSKVAQHNLGCCYRDGIGVIEDGRKAFILFEQSAKQGYIDAIFRLGYCYDEGIGTNIDKEKASKFYKKAAKKGSLEAQNNLGRLYEKKKMFEKSIRWYKRAADNGHRLAQLNLGKIYENGRCGKKDVNESFKYYKKSVEYKRPCALNLLGENGISIGNNIIKAIKSYKKLAKQEYQEAQYKVAYFYEKGNGTKVDKKAAIELYSKLAKKRHTLAQIRLGVLYEREKNLKEAIYWYNKAAENGNEGALFNLGRCYQYKKKENEAFEYYKQSAEKGYIDGIYQLGNCYDKGFGTEINKIKAFELYKEAVEQGSRDGIYQLGNCYDKGIGTEVNKTKAFELYIKIAEKNKFAQNDLGVLYEKGEGTKKNLNMAFDWYKKAAENGNETAQHNLGNCYRLGIGVEKNENKAFKYYKKSAEQGYIDGIYQLGNCYDKGFGTKINKVKAFELYKEAFEQGSIDGIYQLGNCYDKGIGTEINKEKAIELYKKAAEKENKFAQHNLGILYENGDGIGKNLEKAFYWYNKAAENRNDVALYDLGRCYEQGIGVEKDDVEAFKFYKQSVEYGNSNAQYKVADYNHRGLESYGEKVDTEYEFI